MIKVEVIQDCNEWYVVCPGRGVFYCKGNFDDEMPYDIEVEIKECFGGKPKEDT